MKKIILEKQIISEQETANVTIQKPKGKKRSYNKISVASCKRVEAFIQAQCVDTGGIKVMNKTWEYICLTGKFNQKNND